VSEPQFYHFVFAFYAKKISSIFSTISEINVSIKKNVAVRNEEGRNENQIERDFLCT